MSDDKKVEVKKEAPKADDKRHAEALHLLKKALPAVHVELSKEILAFLNK